MTKEQLAKIYYQPENIWRCRKAIKMLRAATEKISTKALTHWLTLQALWQVHLPKPKRVDYAHFYVTKVNKIHQADLLYLPHDKVYQSMYKYVLNVIDIASGYKASRPLRTKKASEVAEMFADIYKKGPLKYPEDLHVDGGTEFNSQVDKLMGERDVEVKRVTTKYHHHFKTLAERLFKIQELNDPTKDSKTWIKHLYKLVTKLNNIKLDRIGTTPAKAVKLEHVELNIKAHSKEDALPVDGLYRYLYQPGELEGGQQRRATDMIWSWDAHRLDRIVEDPGQRVLYYLVEGPKRAFVREQLMLIPENTELPPDSVKRW